MSSTPPVHEFDRFRGWVLIAFYGAMTVLSLMLLYALFMLKDSFQAQSMELYGTMLIAGVSSYFNGSATLLHYRLVRLQSALPRLMLKPFLFMALTLLFAGRLLGNL